MYYPNIHNFQIGTRWLAAKTGVAASYIHFRTSLSAEVINSTYICWKMSSNCLTTCEKKYNKCTATLWQLSSCFRHPSTNFQHTNNQENVSQLCPNCVRNWPLCERELEPVVLVAQLLLGGVGGRRVDDGGRAGRRQRTSRRAPHCGVPTLQGIRHRIRELLIGQNS